MVKGILLRSAALAAMVGAMTVAIPAQAQDVDRAEMREQRMERQAARQEARQQQAPQQARQAPQQARQEFRQQRQAAQAAPVEQSQRAARQEWRQQQAAAQGAPQRQVDRSGSIADRRLERSPDGAAARDRAWERSQSAARPAVNAQQQRTWRGRDGSAAVQGERNRSYSDRDRNGSYRSGYRDGRTVESYRDNRDQRQAYRSGYRDGDRRDLRRGNDRRWDNNWRRDNRYNWYNYRNQNRNIYQAGRYYSPYRNYSYSRLSIGLFLNSGFYGNRYWVNDPWQYRLPEVYGPYKWVRYYDDVILVDIYTGEVVDVIHDFFW